MWFFPSIYVASHAVIPHKYIGLSSINVVSLAVILLAVINAGVLLRGQRQSCVCENTSHATIAVTAEGTDIHFRLK